MINTADLNIEDEIVPLFDFTHNLYSGQALREVVSKTLGSKEDILNRQLILKGFIANHALFKDYSFSRFNLTEIHGFFETLFTGSFSTKKLRWKFIFSEKERHQKRGRLILMVRLFYKIYFTYLKQLDLRCFPQPYAEELEAMNAYFESFNLQRFETAFEKNKFRVRHMVELMLVITEKITSGKATAFWNRWFLFEGYLSISNGIIRHGYVFPTFEDANFSLEEVYHPVLKTPVKNNLFSSSNVILLTGPNMSGKSTFLKAVSICVYLAHAGLAVPASRARMPFFATISAAINLTDSIVSGYSHFMSEIITLKNVLVEAAGDGKCFAVFDELFRGTNMEDALEISAATIKGLLHFPNSLFLISTHLHQIKDMEEIRNGKVATFYIECNLNNNTPAFTYRLKEGWSDLKLGRILFEKEGLNHMLDREQ